MVPYGLVLLANPIRKEAWETFQYFADQGVDIKVISGDNPVTVSKVASQAGIANADNYIDASQLKTPDDIKRAVLKYTVFGRVTPDQKRQFVRALKEAVKDMPVHKPLTQKRRILTSERKLVEITLDGNFMVIGERINPTGKKKLQAELRRAALTWCVRWH